MASAPDARSHPNTEDNKNSRQVCRMFADTVQMNPVKLVKTPSTGARSSGSSMDVVDSLLMGSVEEDISPVHRATAAAESAGWISILTQEGGF